MTHTYQISGMTCGGCEGTVKDRLSSIQDVKNVEVSKADATATITMASHISLEEMQTALGGSHNKYQISSLTNSEPQIFQISGMTCGGCEGTVKDRLSTIENISDVTVSKADSTAIIKMSNHVSLEELQTALGGTNSKYQISKIDKSESGTEHGELLKQTKPDSGPGTYYCPMHCEGDKTYDKFGSCPICGMNLEKVPVLQSSGTQFTCPMHPQILEDEPGACPICGMDLVPLEPVDDDSTYKDMRKKLIIATSFAFPVFVIAMTDMIPNNPLGSIFSMGTWNWIQLALTIPVVYVTRIFFERAWTSLVTRNLNMFTLIGLGTGVAILFSIIGLFFPNIFPEEFKNHDGSVHLYFEAAAVILTLVLLGQVMEARAHSQTNSAIKALLKLVPATAYLLENGEERKIAVDKIQLGNFLRVKPGDKIPVDGKITEGNATVDESMITGEPMPVDKRKDDVVSAGTINGTTSFVMSAEKVGGDTLLAQIIKMVNEASRSRAPIQKLVDRIAGYFVPTVVAISIITFVAWMIWGGEAKLTYALANAIAVLIIACPCALGLATPMSIMVVVGRGAQNGILIKNAEALEHLNKVEVLIIDKTGTITEGKPSVGRLVPESGYEEKNLLMQIASLNQHSEHPLASAIVNFGKSERVTLNEVKNFNSVSGKGVVGMVDGKKIALGNQNLMDQEQVSISLKMKDSVEAEQKTGKTVSYISVDGQLAGFVTLTDSIKPTSKAAIKELLDKNIEVIMLTGDNENTAKSVASELNLTSFKAGMLPEDKLNEIKKLQQQGKVVAMAGDGINDAPALAQANIGIAMGTGTDVAIESAAVTLVKGDLHGIVKSINLSHAVMKNIKQNLFFAFFYNAIGIPIAAGVLYASIGLLLSPMIAGAAMSISSVSVILNSLRLKGVKL